MTRAVTTPRGDGVLLLEDYHRLQSETAEVGIKGFVLFGVLTIAACLGGTVYWAATSKLDGAVVAPASLVVEGNRKTVEHLDGGIVREILVQEGDMVLEGQTLIALDDTEVAADLEVIENQIGELAVRRARLIAQIDGQVSFTLADVVQGLGVPLTSEALLDSFAAQQRLFDAELQSRSAEQDLLTQQVTNLRDQIAGLQEQRASNARQLEITRTELANLETLLQKGLVAVPRVTSRRVEVERLGGIDAALATDEAQARNRIAELELASLGQKRLRVERASTEIAAVEASLATLEPQFLSATERLKRVAVTAPVDGRVVGLTVFTPGGVLRPGETILDIVPGDEPLVVEARVNTADIEKLHIGQSTRVRLSAFDQADIPEATGQIVDISADSFEDERTGRFYYTARVTLDAQQSPDVQALELVPGMPADLFVNTGERTALTFLVQPVKERLARTFIE